MAAGNFDACLKRLLVHEGSNDDDPRDPGGRTSRGIIQSEWTRYVADHPGQGLQSDVWKAPQSAVEDIYRWQYWDALRCDELPAGVDYAVFDFGVNSGIGRSAKYLQAIVGTVQDGQIGPATLIATKAKPAAEIVAALCDRRLAFLKGLRTRSTFGRGWGRRVAEVRTAALAMAAGKGAPAPKIAPAKPVPSLPARPAPAPAPVSRSILAGLGALVLAAAGWFGQHWGFFLAAGALAALTAFLIHRSRK